MVRKKTHTTNEQKHVGIKESMKEIDEGTTRYWLPPTTSDTLLNPRKRHASTIDVRHLHATTLLLGRERCLSFPSSRAKALIALFVLILESEIRGWPRPAEHGRPVLEDVAVRVRPMSFVLGELVRVEIFASGLAFGEQERVIEPQGGRVGGGQDGVDGHGHGDPPTVDGLAEGDPLLGSIAEDVAQAGAE